MSFINLILSILLFFIIFIFLWLRFFKAQEKIKVLKVDCTNCPHKKPPLPEITITDILNTPCWLMKDIYAFIQVCDPYSFNKKWVKGFRTELERKMKLETKNCEGTILLKSLLDNHNIEAKYLRKQWLEDFLLQAEIILKTNCKECSS